MNNFKKRLIALVSLTCVALSMFAGCADSNNDSDTSKKSNDSKNSQAEEIEGMTAFPFRWGSAEDYELTIDGVDINKDDPVKADHVDATKATDETATKDKENTTAYIAGEPITEVVNVTEANGETVTEADGQPVTEVKIIANATPEPDDTANNNNTENNANNDTNTGNENNTPAVTEATSEYISNTKGMYAMWIDISKNIDYYFNDSIIKITFKVKEDAPDGLYNISFSSDLSSIDGKTIVPDTILNGSIKVGNGAAEAVDPSSMNGFAIYGDNVTAKQGDTVEFSINMKDNPGLAALVIQYYFDSNALEVIDCTPDGEFAEVSKNSTQTGEKAE